MRAGEVLIKIEDFPPPLCESSGTDTRKGELSDGLIVSLRDL